MTDSAPTAESGIAMTKAVPVIVAAFLLILAGFGFYAGAPLGPDVSWLLTVSERMLDGQALYTEIMEPNPPMAGFLYILPVAFARLLGIASEIPVIAFTLAFGLAASTLAARIAAFADLLRRADIFFLLCLLFGVVSWGEDFAQREHFAAMAAMPVIAAIAARASGIKLPARFWIAAGCCAALVVAIKPHFALAVILPALYAAWMRRSLRPLLAPEMLLAGMLSIGFVALTWVMFPAFFSEILPAAAATYVPDRRDITALLLLPRTELFLVLCAIILVVFWRFLAARLSMALFLSGLGFFAAYLVQGKGFPYHIMPGTMMVALAAIAGLVERATAQRSRSDWLLAAAGITALVAIPIGEAVAARQVWENEAQILRPYGTGLKIANLTTDLAVTSPLYRMLDGEFVNSGPSLLMTLSAYRVRKSYAPAPEWMERIDAVENAERLRLSEDFERSPPDIIVTSVEGMNWVYWASQDARLAARLKGYHELGQVQFRDWTLLLLGRAGLEKSQGQSAGPAP